MKFSIAVVIAASAAVAVEGARHLHDTEGHARTSNQQHQKHVRTNQKTTEFKTVKDAKSMPRNSEADLHTKIQDIFDGCNVRGGAVAFYDKSFMDAPIAEGYGKVSAASNAQDVTGDTVFMIASMSKVFGGAAVMKLIEDDKIDSEQDDICDVLPEDYGIGACRHPDYEDTEVTWAHILTHTSSMVGGIPEGANGGSPSYGPEGGYDGSAEGNESCPLDDVVAFYRDIMTPTDPAVDGYTEVGNSKNDLNWFKLAAGSEDGSVWMKGTQPGTEEEYSNFATGYLAALTEHALDGEKTFPEYCKEKIFTPAGMTNTAWFRRDLPGGVLEAVPTYWEGNQWKDVSPVNDEHYCFIDYTSGQLHTSAADLSKFLGALVNNYGSGVIYNNAENGKKTLTYQSDVSDFGFCWGVLSNDDKEYAEGWQTLAKDLDWTHAGTHSGGEEGVVTDMYVFPESGLYMAVLSNTSGDNDNCDITGKVMNELMKYRNEMN